MKKLMMAAAIVCAAAISQGAALTWGTGKIFKPSADGTGMSGTVAKTSVTAYYFELDAAKYTALLVAGDYAATAEKVFNEYMAVDGKTFALKEGVSATDSGKLSSNNNSNKNFTDSRTFFTAATDPKTGYAAMILKYSDTAAGQDYYIANLASYTFDADNDKTLTTMGTFQFGDESASKVAISAWTKAGSIPEPTSGLLMLIGVAGLALRRRRA